MQSLKNKNCKGMSASCVGRCGIHGPGAVNWKAEICRERKDGKSVV